MTGKRRVAFVNTHPIQYFAPLYAAINRSVDIEAVPIYLSDSSLRGGFDKGFGQAVTWDIDLLAGTDPIFVRNAAKNDHSQFLRLLAPDIWSIVRRERFDALVVHGYVHGANYLAVAAAKSVGTPVMLRGESHLGLARPGWRRHIRKLVERPLHHRFDAFLAIGAGNRAYYRKLGVNDDRIFSFPYTVDNERLIATAAMGEGERAAERVRLGLDGSPAVLYASKFERRKHPDDLVIACARLAEQGVALQLVLAGSGEMDAELRALAASHPALKVTFPGFVNQRDLPRLFGACDLFVLPSEEEPWGLIINEAMCAGLPIVASREIGSVQDLVRDGDNGRVIEARDVDGLTAAIRDIVSDPVRRATMGRRSLAIVSGWSYAQNEAGLRAALDRVAPLKAGRKS